MTRRNAMAVVLALVAAGCGANSSQGNAAAEKSFTYGTPTTATAAQAGVLQTQLDAALAAQSLPGGTSAVGVADFQSITTTLLGNAGGALGIAGASPAMQRALAGRAAITGGTVSGFDNPTCQTVTASSVTMNGCTTTITSGTTTEKVTVSGSLTLSNSNQTLTWDLSVAVDVTDTSTTGITYSVNVHESGTLTVTASTIKGSMLAETTGKVTYGGMTFPFGFDESVDVDVTYQTNPACITGGTLEAKRVWTQRPIGSTADQYPDLAAKVTWTACNVATIAFSN